MPNFVVQVEGRLVVRADDKEAAKEIVNGILASRQPWLKTSYNAPERIAELNEVSHDEIVSR